MKKFVTILKRFLKRLRLIDILIIGILLILGIVAFTLLFRKATYLTISVKVGADSLVWPTHGAPTWYLSQLSKGIIERDLLGRPNVELLDIFSYPDSSNPNKKMIYLTLKIRAVYSKTTSSYVFNSKPVLVGNTIRVMPGNILIEGLITNIAGVKDPRKDKKLLVETQVFGTDPSFPNTTGVYPYLTEAIKVGDEIYGPRGEVVIKIIDKKVENAKRVIVTDSGRTFLSQDPLKKDLFLTLELNTKEFNEEFYIFDDLKVAVDNTIPLRFRNVVINATIIRLKEE